MWNPQKQITEPSYSQPKTQTQSQPKPQPKTQSTSQPNTYTIQTLQQSSTVSNEPQTQQVEKSKEQFTQQQKLSSIGTKSTTPILTSQDTTQFSQQLHSQVDQTPRTVPQQNFSQLYSYSQPTFISYQPYPQQSYHQQTYPQQTYPQQTYPSQNSYHSSYDMQPTYGQQYPMQQNYGQQYYMPPMMPMYMPMNYPQYPPMMLAPMSMQQFPSYQHQHQVSVQQQYTPQDTGYEDESEEISSQLSQLKLQQLSQTEHTTTTTQSQSVSNKPQETQISSTKPTSQVEELKEKLLPPVVQATKSNFASSQVVAEINETMGILQGFASEGIKGAHSLLDKMNDDIRQLNKAHKQGQAEGALNNLKGHLREVQVANGLKARGEEILELGWTPKDKLGAITDIDIVTKDKQGDIYFYQVKAGNKAVIKPYQSSVYDKFENQLQASLTHLELYPAGNAKGLVYVVDDLSNSVKQLLKKQNVPYEFSDSL